MKKTTLEQLIRDCRITRIGKGYIDLICPTDMIEPFLRGCTALGLSVTGFTWWCHANESHPPCGMGGPRDCCGDGWYSEIAMEALHTEPDNDRYLRYLCNEWPHSPAYRACFVPGFCLE